MASSLDPSPKSYRLFVVVPVAAVLVSVLLQGPQTAVAPGSASIPRPGVSELAQPRPSLAPLGVDALISQAQQKRLVGAYEDAAALYSQAYAQHPSPELQVPLHAAEALLAAKSYQLAVDMARTASRDQPSVDDAHVIEGQALAAMGDVNGAVAALQRVQSPALQGYAWFLQGKILADQGDGPAASRAYQQALGPPMSRLWHATAARRAATGLVSGGDPGSAVSILQGAASVADAIETNAEPTWFNGDIVAIASEARRPPILLDLAVAQEAAGVDAAATYAEIASDYPTSDEAPIALARLDALGKDDMVSSYWQGRILYANGRPSDAVAAFQAFLATEPSEAEAAAALYYSALAEGALGDTAEERAELDAMGHQHTESVLAPAALATVARIVEQSGTVDDAVQAYTAVAEAYPGSSQAVDSLLRAADLEDVSGDSASARALWQRLADAPPTSRARAQALFRLGRSFLQQGDQSTGLATLAEAADTAPASYEGLRARDLATGGLGAEPFNRQRASSLAPGSRGADDDQACAGWLATWSSPSDPGDLAPVLDRIHRLQAVGLAAAAEAEALDAAMDLRTEPDAVLGLARDLNGHGLYASSIYAANTVAAGSPAGTSDAAPGCLGRLAYPLAFSDLVQSEASKDDFDPYVLIAQLRQESWFDPLARSAAPAYGLSQITPSTASEIARGMLRTNVSVDDLYRPRDSVAFGAWYLGQQVHAMNDRVLLGLAAYNGGAGNVLSWAAGNRSIDPDEFVDAIGFAETRSYVRSTYEIYAQYRLLYG